MSLLLTITLAWVGRVEGKRKNIEHITKSKICMQISAIQPIDMASNFQF